MADPASTYLIVLFIGIALTVGVGQILIRSGRPFLEDVFRQRETATSVTRLLVVLFHLIVLGVVALVATIDITLDHPVQSLVVRVGLVLLVVGAAYGGTLLLLTRLRARRQLQLLIEEETRLAEETRQAPPPYGHPGLAAQYPPDSAAPPHRVIEPGPGR